MSNAGKIASYAIGYIFVVTVVGGIVLSLLAMTLMFLIPIATAGAVQFGWSQAIAAITVAVIGLLLARLIVK